MNYDSLIKNQTYLFQSEQNSSLQNHELIIKIFEEIHFGKPDIIIYNSSTIDYDIFNVSLNNKSYIVKISLDEFDNFLKYEFNLIEKNKINNLLQPLYYNKFKFGDIIHYSIYLDEKYESIKDFGLGCIIENTDSFVDSYFNLQKSIKPKNKHKEIMINFINNHSISFFDQDIIEAISNNCDLNKIKEIIDSLHSEIFKIFQSNIFNKDEFCHGDLNQSNILYCFDHFKFINLCNSFEGNLYYDLANLVINCNLNNNLEKKLFDSVLKNKKSNLVAEEWMEYRQCFDLVLRKIFLEILFNFLKEVYIFESERPFKLLDVIDTFSQNQSKFMKIAVISKNFEFIYNLFLQPLIGVENKNN